MKNVLLISTGLVLILTGCQNDSEKRLARGCEAAAKVMLAKEKYDRQIDSIKSSKLGMSDGFRLVTINTVTKTKEFSNPQDESFECKFEESSGPFGFAWRAALVQIKIDDVIYGSEGGEIYGSIEDQLALTAAVESAMK
jgi:hypothetical protein